MSNPFAVLPKDKTGRLRAGLLRNVKHHELEQAIKEGWEPVRPTDRHSCHHDDYAVLCRRTKRPWWRRVMAMFRRPI